MCFSVESFSELNVNGKSYIMYDANINDIPANWSYHYTDEESFNTSIRNMGRYNILHESEYNLRSKIYSLSNMIGYNDDDINIGHNDVILFLFPIGIDDNLSNIYGNLITKNVVIGSQNEYENYINSVFVRHIDGVLDFSDIFHIDVRFGNRLILI